MPIIQEIQCVCMCMHFYACGTCNTDSAIYQPIAFILVVPHSFFLCVKLLSAQCLMYQFLRVTSKVRGGGIIGPRA